MLPLNQGEVEDRLKLIETMMTEGRQTTERWGWSFLLWGIGPLIAMLWSARWPHGALAWPVTVGVSVVLNGIVLKLRSRQGEARTIAMQSIGAIWKCTGVTVLILGFAAVWAHTLEYRFLYVAVFALTAVAHGSSSLILRWWPQFLAALVWWIASTLALVAPKVLLEGIAVVGLLLGNVVFGGWLSFCEWKRRDGRG